MPTPLTDQEQFQALNVLDYLTDLLTIADREMFTRDDILVLLDNVRSDRDFFDPEVVIAQQIATSEVP